MCGPAWTPGHTPQTHADTEGSLGELNVPMSRSTEACRMLGAKTTT